MKTLDTFDFELSSPLTYHHEGTSKEGQLLVLTAPSNRHHKFRVPLQQSFFRALTDMRMKRDATGASDNDDDSGGDNKLEGAEVLGLLLSSGVDMVKFHEDFRQLLCAGGICKVEGEADLTKTLWENIDPNDTDELLGKYMANFILASVLKTLSES